MGCNLVVTSAHHETGDRRSHAEEADFVILHKFPEPSPGRIVRSSLRQNQGRTGKQAGDSLRRSDKPAHVGYPKQSIGRFQVKAEKIILAGLPREAAMSVDGAFRPTGCPGR